MKKLKILGVLCGIFLSTALASAQTMPFTINGKLNNITPLPQKIYLTEFGKGLLKAAKDSSIVQNGEYHFQGEINGNDAVGVQLSSDTNKNAIQTSTVIIMVDKGEIDITHNSAINNIISSGPASLAQHQLEDMRANSKLKMDTLKQMVASDQYKTDAEFKKKVQSKAIAAAGETILEMYNYTKNNPSARVNPYATYLMVVMPLLTQKPKDTLVNNIPENEREGTVAKLAITTNAANLNRMDSLAKVAAARQQDNLSKVATGSKELDFTMNDTTGKPVSLSSMKGKYVLVDFWASWCAPCRAENPNVVKAYNTYKGKGFTVLGISLDGQSTKAGWLKAIAKDGLLWTQLSDLNGWSNSAAKLYDVKSIPQNFLIDPNGVIIAKDLRGEDLNLKLASLFK